MVVERFRLEMGRDCRDITKGKKDLRDPQMVAKLPRHGTAPSPTPKRKPKFSSRPKIQPLSLQHISTPSLTLTAVTFRFWVLEDTTQNISILLSSSMGQNTVPSKSAFPAFHGLDSTYSFPLESASIFRADAFDLRSEGVIWLLAQGPS
jgi:hypothetical protein